MAGNTSFIESQPAQAWLAQFNVADQPIVVDLLRSMLLVSRDEFTERLRALLIERLDNGDGPVGLYVERELPKDENDAVRPLFSEHEIHPRRAAGNGPEPLQSLDPSTHDVGSEGLVAQLISEVCRQRPGQAFNHPGPDQIRAHRIRRFMLVTDLVGSGQRIADYLEAAWQVASVKSWWSRRQRHGMHFEVVAYASTTVGRRRVLQHASSPAIFTVALCPTVSDLFSREKAKMVVDVCMRYDPRKADPVKSMGFGGKGVLMAFAHGIPNNAPRILHVSSKRWLPLFPKRVTSRTRHVFSSSVTHGEDIRDRLASMRQQRLAQVAVDLDLEVGAAPLLLVLAASTNWPGRVDAIAAKTGLTYEEVRRAIDRCFANDWISLNGRLTDAGKTELASIRRSREHNEAEVSTEPVGEYYPTALRAPVGNSS